MQEKILSWEVTPSAVAKKTSAWYWSVGIVAFGVAAASGIAGNILLAFLAIISAVAIMLAGSQQKTAERYVLTVKGFHFGTTVIPFENILQFALKEEEPRTLFLKTSGLTGVVSFPLSNADYRTIRSELKNRNVEEVDELGSVGASVAKFIGL